MLLLALLVIQIGDLVTTAIGFKRGLAEASPVPAKLFEKFGYWPVAISIKLAMLSIAWAAQHFIINGWMFTALLCLIGLGVCAWNIRLLAKES
jgi:hypothetical protein